jgi:uncharacterized protein (UPF0548 family)
MAVALHLRRPGDADLDALLARCRHDEPTYAPIGCSLGGPTPAGMTRRHWEIVLPAAASFDRARRALDAWAIHRGAGLAVRADGPLAVGTNVAMSAPMPVGFIDVTCRIVQVVDEPDRFGFAYGTLPVHPEAGEESFLVYGSPLTFAVEAVARPVHRLARMAPPIADRLQGAAADRYLTAMSVASVS